MVRSRPFAITTLLLGLLGTTSMAHDSLYIEVSDAVSGRSLIGASVRCDNERWIAYTDGKGIARARLREARSTVIVRALGYVADTIEVSGRSRQVDVYLFPLTRQPVLVTADLDATQLVQRVAQRCRALRSRPDCLDYTMYSLKELFIHNNGESNSAGVESISRIVYEPGPPTRSDVRILSTRRFGGQAIDDTVVTYDDDFDLADSSIIIRGVDYPIPTSVTGLMHYEFSYVTDSCTPELSLVKYAPRTKGAPGFEGFILINRVDTLFIWTDQYLVNSKNLPFIKRLRYRQYFDPLNTWFWLPVKEELLGEIRANILLDIVTTNADVKLVRSVLDVARHVGHSNCVADTIELGNRLVQVALDPEYGALLETISLMDTTITRTNTVPPKGTSEFGNIDWTGFHIARIGTIHLHILPWLFRSQGKNNGYGAQAMLRGSNLTFGGGFGITTDNEYKWLLRGESEMTMGTDSVTIGLSYARDIRTVQHPFAGKLPTLELSYLSVAFPGFYEYVGLYDFKVDARYSSRIAAVSYTFSLLDYRLTDALVANFSRSAQLSLQSRFRQHSLNFTLFGGGIVSPWYEAQRPFSGRATLQYTQHVADSAAGILSAEVDLYSTVTLEQTDLGRIRLHSNAQIGWSTDGAPAQFASMVVPQYCFGGDLLSHATLLPNGLYSTEKYAARLELDVDDIPFRVLGVPDIEGIRPRLSFVCLGTYLSNLSSLYTSEVQPSASLIEIGFRLRSVPLIFTSLIQVDVGCYWQVAAHGLPATPFAFTIGVSLPL